jgi:hypothetical protein
MRAIAHEMGKKDMKTVTTAKRLIAAMCLVTGKIMPVTSINTSDRHIYARR